MRKTQGTLSNGVKWLFDGDDVYIYAADRDEWLIPCLASLSEPERDELSAIGAEMNALKEVEWRPSQLESSDPTNISEEPIRPKAERTSPTET